MQKKIGMKKIVGAALILKQIVTLGLRLKTTHLATCDVAINILINPYYVLQNI